MLRIVAFIFFLDFVGMLWIWAISRGYKNVLQKEYLIMGFVFGVVIVTLPFFFLMRMGVTLTFVPILTVLALLIVIPFMIHFIFKKRLL